MRSPCGGRNGPRPPPVERGLRPTRCLGQCKNTRRLPRIGNGVDDGYPREYGSGNGGLERLGGGRKQGCGPGPRRAVLCRERLPVHHGNRRSGRVPVTVPARPREGVGGPRSGPRGQRADGGHLAALLVSPGLRGRPADRPRRFARRLRSRHRGHVRESPAGPDRGRDRLAERRRFVHVGQSRLPRPRQEEPGAGDGHAPAHPRRAQAEGPDRGSLAAGLRPPARRLVAAVGSRLVQAERASRVGPRPPDQGARDRLPVVEEPGLLL